MKEESGTPVNLSEEIHEMRTALGALAEAVRRQDERLARLEDATLNVAPTISSAQGSLSPGASSVVPPPPPRYESRNGVKPRFDTVGTSFEERKVGFTQWFGVDWLMKVGALLILLGFGWFVSYAFINDWIGPVGRIALGVLVGVGILAGGFVRLRISVNQGGVLLGLGTATTLLTIFAAREIYDFFTPFLAVVFMSLVVVFTAYSSLVSRSRAIAFMSLIAGGIAPLLAAGRSDFLGLFSYLFLLSAGTLWIVRLTVWRALVFAALSIVSLYSLPFIAGLGNVERFEALLVAFSFAVLFFTTGFLGILKDRVAEKWDLLVVALNGFLLLGWIHQFVPAYLQSATAVFVAVVFAVGAFLVYRATAIAAPVYLYAGNAILFFVVATAYELSGAVFVIALALETGLIIVGSLLLLRSVRISQQLSWLMAIPMVFLMESVGRYAQVFPSGSVPLTSVGTGWYNGGVFTSDFFAILVVAGVAGMLAFLFRSAETGADRERKVSPSHIFLVLSTLCALFLVWFALKRAISDADVATILALVIYTVAGIALYLKGRSSEQRDVRIFGTALLMLVIARLLFVEVWHMDIFGKIVTFFTIGALFISTAFIGRKKAPSAENIVAFVILVLSPIAFAAHPAIARDLVPMELSAYEYVKDISVPRISVPTVVEMPISDPFFRKGGFSVYAEESKSFQPILFRSASQEKRAVLNVATVDAGPTVSLTDRDDRTSVEFPVNEDLRNVAEIRITSLVPMVLSGIALDLAPHGSLPKTAEIRFVREDGDEVIALAETPISGRTIRFPKQRSSAWIVRFSYAQPLRITEISFFEEDIPVTRLDSIRFLAQPGVSYRMYFGADRPVSPYLGESGNLSDDRDVLRLSEAVTSSNSLYVPADVDADGVRDLLDNCVAVANPDQADVNGNGRGDVCDDYDKDGIANGKDNCQNDPNRNQLDTDGDGKGDVCDSEESRITEKYVWLPWAAMVIAGFVVAGLFAETIRRERKNK